MTEPSEAAKAKACELTVEHGGGTWLPDNIGADTPRMMAFARFIQQVSDAAKAVLEAAHPDERNDRLAPFILPEPVDPLAAAIKAAIHEARGGDAHEPADTRLLNALLGSLAKRNLKIVEAQ